MADEELGDNELDDLLDADEEIEEPEPEPETEPEPDEPEDEPDTGSEKAPGHGNSDSTTRSKLYMSIVIVAVAALVMGVVIGYLMGGDSDLDDRVKDLEADLADKDTEITGLQANITNNQDKIQQLQSDLFDNISRLSNANENITALEGNITTLSNDISNLLDENEVLLMEADLREPHILHLESPFLDLDCADCHDVDNSGAVIIREDSYYDESELLTGHTFRRDVNVAECAECHGPFPDIMPEDNMNVTWLEENDESCTTCHDDWDDRMDGVTDVDLDYIRSQVTGADTETIAETCLSCHGGQQWYMEGP